jgi:hypothetical protein
MSDSARDEGGPPGGGRRDVLTEDGEHGDAERFVEAYDEPDEVLGGDEPRFHDGMPITGYYRGEPIPDLDALPQDRWLEVLRPLSFWPRTHAVSRVSTLERAQAALEVKGQLLLEDGRRSRSLDDGPPPPLPAGAPPPRGTSHQVNFRLGPAEHANLLEAARLFAMRPTALARVLTVRGVHSALYEERRDR